MPSLTKNWMPWMNELSSIVPSAHQPALFLIHVGISFDSSVPWDVESTTIIPSLIKNWIPWTNESSSIVPSAHQPALFFTQDGIIFISLTFDISSFKIGSVSQMLIGKLSWVHPLVILIKDPPSL